MAEKKPHTGAQHAMRGEQMVDKPQQPDDVVPDKKEFTEEEEDAELAKRKPVPITKATITNTVHQMFGKDAECIWGKSSYKKRKSLRIQFSIMNHLAGFEIRDAIDLVEVARVIVSIYGRVRATIIEEMAAGVAFQKRDEMKERVQREKDRMAGIDPDSKSSSS